jgi:hypothetical protein
VRRRLPDHSVGEQRRHLHRQRRADAGTLSDHPNKPTSDKNLSLHIFKANEHYVLLIQGQHEQGFKGYFHEIQISMSTVAARQRQDCFFLGQRPLVPFLLLGPPFFSDYSFWSTTLLTGMTGISLHMQWPLTSQMTGLFPIMSLDIARHWAT